MLIIRHGVPWNQGPLCQSVFVRLQFDLLFFIARCRAIHLSYVGTIRV